MKATCRICPIDGQGEGISPPGGSSTARIIDSHRLHELDSLRRATLDRRANATTTARAFVRVNPRRWHDPVWHTLRSGTYGSINKINLSLSLSLNNHKYRPKCKDQRSVEPIKDTFPSCHHLYSNSSHFQEPIRQPWLPRIISAKLYMLCTSNGPGRLRYRTPSIAAIL